MLLSGGLVVCVLMGRKGNGEILNWAIKAEGGWWRAPSTVYQLEKEPGILSEGPHWRKDLFQSGFYEKKILPNQKRWRKIWCSGSHKTIGLFCQLLTDLPWQVGQSKLSKTISEKITPLKGLLGSKNDIKHTNNQLWFRSLGVRNTSTVILLGICSRKRDAG